MEIVNSLNSILLEGDVSKAPEMKILPAGSKVCTFEVESSRYFKDKAGELEKETSAFKIEAWGKLAESCDETLDLGRGVRIVGRLKRHSWTGQTRQVHSEVVIVAEHVEFKPVARRNPE